MPVQTGVSQQTSSNYEPLSPDVYQVQIIDIEEQLSEYKGVEQKQFKFFCQLATPLSDKDHGKPINFWTSQSFNAGGGKYQPSKLFLLTSAIYKHYDPQVKMSDKHGLTADEINGLIGKQVRLNIEVRDREDGTQTNKVTGFLPIKQLIEFEPIDWKKTDSQEDFEKEVGIS